MPCPVPVLGWDLPRAGLNILYVAAAVDHRPAVATAKHVMLHHHAVHGRPAPTLPRCRNRCTLCCTTLWCCAARCALRNVLLVPCCTIPTVACTPAFPSTLQGCHHWLLLRPLPAILPLPVCTCARLPGLSALLTGRQEAGMHGARTTVSTYALPGCRVGTEGRGGCWLPDQRRADWLCVE